MVWAATASGTPRLQALNPPAETDRRRMPAGKVAVGRTMDRIPGTNTTDRGVTAYRSGEPELMPEKTMPAAFGHDTAG
jgi:hypothetical protein